MKATGPKGEGRAAGGDLLDPEPDLLVVGAGPVGLVALLAALTRGLRVQGVERKSRQAWASQTHSRAIGIHPPSLALLEGLGVAEALATRGLRVTGGEARTGPGADRTALLGRLSFREVLPPPWDHVLTLPQPETEAILAAAIEAEAPAALQHGVEVVGVEEGADRLRVQLADGRSVRPRFLLACDGRGSRLRTLRGTAVSEHTYPHRYLMGDFPDPELAGATEAEALLYLAPGGLVEGLPLPGGVRRWVVERDAHTGSAPSLEELVRTVADRTGVRLDPGACQMHSAFGVERRHAATTWEGRVLLGGDAAHVVSPIGGQGMNLGWLQVAAAVDGLGAVLDGRAPRADVARRHNRWVGRLVREGARRAEQNMALGHRPPLGPLGVAARSGLVRLLLATPARRILARRFTMQGLAPWPGQAPKGLRKLAPTS